MIIGGSHACLGTLALAASLSISSPAIAADIQFGEAPSFSSEKFGTYAVSDDKKAFQIVFDQMELGETGKALATPVVTRVLSIVIPFTVGQAAQANVTVPIHFEGVAVIDPGAQGTAIFSINGQTTSLAFGPNTKDDQPFVQTLNLDPGNSTEARITILLSLTRDVAAKDVSAFLHLSTINSENFTPKK